MATEIIKDLKIKNRILIVTIVLLAVCLIRKGE